MTCEAALRSVGDAFYTFSRNRDNNPVCFPEEIGRKSKDANDGLLSLLGGLALFLYGMQMMSSGLEAAAACRMKQILERLTANRFWAYWWARRSRR